MEVGAGDASIVFEHPTSSSPAAMMLNVFFIVYSFFFSMSYMDFRDLYADSRVMSTTLSPEFLALMIASWCSRWASLSLLRVSVTLFSACGFKGSSFLRITCDGMCIFCTCLLCAHL